MNEVQQITLTLGTGVLCMVFLGRLVSRWSAHHKIHQTFQQKGTSITRIRRFHGFLDLGSFLEAATSAGYMVTVVTHHGSEAELFCLVRYIPMIGIARSVEIWSDESTNA